MKPPGIEDSDMSIHGANNTRVLVAIWDSWLMKTGEPAEPEEETLWTTVELYKTPVSIRT